MDILTDALTLERAEALAYADMFRAAPRTLGFGVHETPIGIALSLPKVDALLFNRLIVLDGDAPGLEPHVARFRGLGLSRFGIQAAPAFATRTLQAELLAAGLTARDGWIKLARPAGPVAPATTPLRIAPARAEDAERFGTLACDGFGLPTALVPALAALVGREGWRAFIAWSGKSPVACACLYAPGPIGWLGVAATLPDARRRGGQSALFAARLEEGMRMGCRAFVTETAPDRPERPNPSLHNALRAGFTEQYERTNWLPVP